MKIFVTGLLIILVSQIGIGQTHFGGLEGKVMDEASKEVLLFATLKICQNGSDSILVGKNSDFDGNYLFTNLANGLYDIEVSYVGYRSRKIKGVKVENGQITKLNIELSNGVCCVIVSKVVSKVVEKLPIKN